MCRTLTAVLGPAAALTALGPLAALVSGAVGRPAALPGPGGVVSMHVRLFGAIDAGDAEQAASFVGPRADASLFLSRAGQPVAVQGRNEVADELAAWARACAGGGHRTVVTPVSADCPSSDLAHAVLEIERTSETAAGPRVERWLSTSLVQHTDGGWKLRHWHLSPAPPVPPEPPEPSEPLVK